MKEQPKWSLPKYTDKIPEVIIHSASTLNPDGTKTEYYNRERDGHKELCELLPQVEDDIKIFESETYKDAFPGLTEQDIIYSQHQIILNLKKRVADLESILYGHNISLNQNY